MWYVFCPFFFALCRLFSVFRLSRARTNSHIYTNKQLHTIDILDALVRNISFVCLLFYFVQFLSLFHLYFFLCPALFSTYENFCVCERLDFPVHDELQSTLIKSRFQCDFSCSLSFLLFVCCQFDSIVKKTQNEIVHHQNTRNGTAKKNERKENTRE